MSYCFDNLDKVLIALERAKREAIGYQADPATDNEREALKAIYDKAQSEYDKVSKMLEKIRSLDIPNAEKNQLKEDLESRLKSVSDRLTKSIAEISKYDVQKAKIKGDNAGMDTIELEVNEFLSNIIKEIQAEGDSGLMSEDMDQDIPEFNDKDFVKCVLGG